MNNNQFDELMSAATFAQSGEHETARSILKGKDRILAAVSDMAFDSSVFSYALNICKRTQCELDILYLTRTGSHMDEIRSFMSRAAQEGITSIITKKDGCMKQAILDYTSKKRSVLFVVVGTTPELDIECKAGEKSLSEAWKRLKCPLVVVSRGESPSVA
ncbi:MAG TPA: hypothetical protein VEP69_05595 [Thermodesulfovibrionales bacterium]|nr:hypothetical protein [Thermodesulfovibrionales bacterium]